MIGTGTGSTLRLSIAAVKAWWIHMSENDFHVTFSFTILVIPPPHLSHCKSFAARVSCGNFNHNNLDEWLCRLLTLRQLYKPINILKIMWNGKSGTLKILKF